ncbi:MAG: hypothetical protein JWR69_2367 [Pedosphaera sp.]|nr:hypothetical protein [Pedosphaera sp.]
MLPVPITTLLNMKESETFDFKSGQYKFYRGTDEEKSELLKDIMAFANAWKTGDAYIVIGVSEKNGGRDQVVGVTEHLKDNDIQQFVKSKTNHPVRFSIYSDTAEGKDIDIIRVEMAQQRPIYSANPFGKLKAEDVHIRVGSSTEVASGAKVAEMTRADLEARQGQTSLELEFADVGTRQRLGTETKILCLSFIEPPPKPSPSASLGKPILRYGPPETKERPFVQAYNVTVGSCTPPHQPTSEQMREYATKRNKFACLGLWIKNLGVRNLSSVKIRIHLPNCERMSVVDEHGLPKKPRGPFELVSPSDSASNDTRVRASQHGWIVETNAGTLQPQEEYWSDSKFYVATDDSRTIDALATIFADDLANPIKIPLKIHTDIHTLDWPLADVAMNDPSKIKA